MKEAMDKTEPTTGTGIKSASKVKLILLETLAIRPD